MHANAARRLESAPPGWAPARAARGARAAPLVGRAHELAALEALSPRVADEGRPRLVTVVGQAGIGKTRLVDELSARATGHRLRGRCLPYGEGITYWALREILWSAAGIRLDDGAAAAAASCARSSALSPTRRAGHAALAASAGIALPGPAREEPSPESVAEEIGLAWPRLLSALGARACVVVEDLHWAEPPLLDMLEAIVARATARCWWSRPRGPSSASAARVGRRPGSRRSPSSR